MKKTKSRIQVKVRKGQAADELSRDTFRARFFDKFTDPAFRAEASALERIEVIAWDGYTNTRKSPLTHPAVDRLVCADSGLRHRARMRKKAKQIELAGWPYPKHLAGRTYGLVVHGDVAGIEGVRRSLSDWLDWMGLIDAGTQARLDRYIGYYKPYATSHDELDQDKNVQKEVRNVARAVAEAVRALRAGKLSEPDSKLESPRPK